MWLIRQLAANKRQSKPPVTAEVTESLSHEISVQEAKEHQKVRQLSPYGVYSFPPVGEECVLLWAGAKEACSCFMNEKAEVLPGELYLFSQGGAFIHLKNDGAVVINGQNFPANTKE